MQIQFCLFVCSYLCTQLSLEHRLFIFQVSLHEMSTKKEQIAEALQTTQSFLAKHSDKYAIFLFLKLCPLIESIHTVCLKSNHILIL